MGKGTKKQHFVPQLLLRQFADPNERIFCYDMSRDRSFATNVRDAGHQNQFFSVLEADGQESPGVTFESYFQRFETLAAGAIRRIEAALTRGVAKVVSDIDRSALAGFIAVQFLRTPAARERSMQMMELMQRTLMVEIAERNGFDPSDPEIAQMIGQATNIPRQAEAALHGRPILASGVVEQLTAIL